MTPDALIHEIQLSSLVDAVDEVAEILHRMYPTADRRLFMVEHINATLTEKALEGEARH